MNIKIAMLAFAGIAFMQLNADAQSSKFDKNYPVCKHNGKYTTCTHKEAMENKKEFSAGIKTDNKVIKDSEPTKVLYTNRDIATKEGVAVAYEMPAEVFEADKPKCDREIYITGAQAGYSKDNPYFTSTIVCVSSESANENPRFKVSYDQPGDIYDGENVLANDGVKKNLYRNMNYLDFRSKVPNDGGLASK